MTALQWAVLAIAGPVVLALSFVVFAVRGERRRNRREQGW